MRPRLPGTKSSQAVAIAVVAGLILGFLLVPRSKAPGDPDTPLPEVRVLGEVLRLDATAPKAALERVRRYAAGKLRFELPDGKLRELYLGELGAEIDKVRLANLVRDA